MLNRLTSVKSIVSAIPCFAGLLFDPIAGFYLLPLLSSFVAVCLLWAPLVTAFSRHATGAGVSLWRSLLLLFLTLGSLTFFRLNATDVAFHPLLFVLCILPLSVVAKQRGFSLLEEALHLFFHCGIAYLSLVLVTASTSWIFLVLAISFGVLPRLIQNAVVLAGVSLEIPSTKELLTRRKRKKKRAILFSKPIVWHSRYFSLLLLLGPFCILVLGYLRLLPPLYLAAAFLVWPVKNLVFETRGLEAGERVSDQFVGQTVFFCLLVAIFFPLVALLY